MASSLFLSTISDRYQILSTNQTVHCRCSPTVDILRQISNTISTNQTVDILGQMSNSLSTNETVDILRQTLNSLCSLQTIQSIYADNIKFSLFSTNQTVDIFQQISNSLRVCSIQSKMSIFSDRYQILSVSYKSNYHCTVEI